MRVITTLNFAGRTEEALELYRNALDANIVFLMRFRDCPDRSLVQAGREDQIFHATFRIGETEFMASDVASNGALGVAVDSRFALAIQADTPERAHEMFNALSDGGTIQIALAKAEFTTLYGIVVDQFGIAWKMTVA